MFCRRIVEGGGTVKEAATRSAYCCCEHDV